MRLDVCVNEESMEDVCVWDWDWGWGCCCWFKNLLCKSLCPSCV